MAETFKNIVFPTECFDTAYFPQVQEVELGTDPVDVDKFGGRPFLALNEPWPRCDEGKPMNFWFQLTDPRPAGTCPIAGKTIQLFMSGQDEWEDIPPFLRFVDYNQPHQENLTIPSDCFHQDGRSEIMTKRVFLVTEWQHVKEMRNECVVKEIMAGAPLHMTEEDENARLKKRAREYFIFEDIDAMHFRALTQAVSRVYGAKEEWKEFSKKGSRDKEYNERKLREIASKYYLSPSDFADMSSAQLKMLLREKESCLIKKPLFPMNAGGRELYELSTLIMDFNAKQRGVAAVEGTAGVKFGGHVDSCQGIDVETHIIQLNDEEFLPYVWADSGVAHIMPNADDPSQLDQEIIWDV